MRKLLLPFILLMFSLCNVNNMQAQIALDYTDTALCPGMPLQMCASLSGLDSKLRSDDDFSGIIDIGFPFVFFGNTYTKCVISGNAMLSFDTTLASLNFGYTWGRISNPSPFGGQVVANNAIFAAFCDWYLPTGGTLKYQRYGPVGRRRFIVEWCHVPAFIGVCEQQKVTTQIILYEGSNLIDVQTTEVPPLSPACPSSAGSYQGGPAYYQQVVQGVRNSTGLLEFYPVDRDPVPSATNWGVTGTVNDGMRFTPNGVSTYMMDPIPFNPWVILDSVNSSLLQWFADGEPNLSIGNGACVSVVTNANTHYYTVNYAGYAGCQDDSVNFTDTIHIHFNNSVTNIHQEICAGMSFNWMGNVLFAPGNYDTLLYSSLGCDSTVTLNLVINPLPDVSIGGSSHVEICDGSSTKISLLHPEFNTSYQWMKDNAAVSGETSPAYNVDQSGIYKVTATSAQGCSATSRPITLVVNPNPEAKILPLSNEIGCTYDTLTLQGKIVSDYDYLWSPAESFRAITGAEGQRVEGVFNVPETEVVLTVFNKYGCYDRDTTMVHTKPCCNMMMPNAFSPNGDGTNDYFKPLLQPAQILLSFKIYDRYGKLVYNNTDLKHGWNGRYPNGDEANQDVYMYYVKYTCADGKLYERKQDVILIR